MAKAKSGGTRSYLRGRIANDVYSIGKDGQGKKQQVVRSLAESVSNPRTTAQMAGRMIMSTVMQAVSGMSQLIDHSFDGVPNGQPSISEFIRRNYALVKADAAAHPANGNSFGLVQYGEKGAKAGKYVIAAGSAILPAAVTTTFSNTGGFGVTGLTTGFNAKAFRDAIGLSKDDYITRVIIQSDGAVVFYRIRIATTLADDTVVTGENVGSLVTIENPFGLTINTQLDGGSVSLLTPDVECVAMGTIVSVKTDGGYTHNDAVMVTGTANDYTSDVALPTYPIGSAKFLNGGDL